MSASNPRHASNWNLLFALLGFFVYYNFINLTQAWVGSGRLGLGAALLVAHGGAFVLGARPALVARARHARGAVDARRRRRRRRAAAAARRMRTVRRLFYVDIVSAVVFVALAFLALFFFIDFVDELRRRRPARLQRALHAAALLAAARAGPPLRADADRGADRHHLRAGAPGADLAVHDPAHRRPRPGPGARAAGQPGAGLRRRSPSSSATTSRRSASSIASQLRAAFSGSLKLEPLGRLDQGALADARRASAATRSTSARPSAGAMLRDVRIFEFDADGRLLAPHRGGARPRSRATAPGRCADVDAAPAGVDAGAAPTAPRGAARRARLAQHALAQRRRRRGAAGDDDVDGRALALHRPPRRQRAGGAAAEDPVLEARPLPVRLPGDGRPGPALRLPAARARAASA